MVRGKPNSRLDRGVDIPITLSLEIGFYMLLLINTMGAGRKFVPCSQALSTSQKERQTVVWERPDGVPNVCVRSAWPG